MAINPSAVWRARPSGSNTNGGGYDTGIATAASGTNGSFNTATNVFTDATANAFTAGMVGRSIYIPNVGQYKITANGSSSTVTLGSGNPGPLLANMTGISWQVGAGTDYSQQNSAQATGTAGAASGGTTFTDATAAAFTSAMVGNAMYITGGGLTTGWYFVTAFTSSTQVTLDRTPGTGSAATWHLGGGWADPWTNLQTGTSGVTSGSFPVVGQNIVYVLGSGTPNPASYSYDYTLGASQTNWVVGSNTTGNIVIENDPATSGYKPWPDLSGGMALINCNSNVFFQTFNSQWVSIRGLWIVQPGSVLLMGGFRDSDVRGIVFDCKDNVCEVEGMALGCEVWYSGTPATGATVHAFAKTHIVNCYVHDYPGLGADNSGPITGSIFRKCGNGAIKTGGNSFGPYCNNTIDATVGHGVEYDNISRLTTQCFNNIISNIQTVGKAAIKGPGGTAAVNSSIATCIARNVFYNNLANYTDFIQAPYDTTLSVDPFVNQSTGDYTLA